MKEVLIIALLAISISGCEHPKNRLTPITDDIDIVIIDSCQYLQLTTIHGACIIHKENCSNPNHHH